MGIRTPLPDSSSLPIGAAEVTILDHTAAYAAFPNLGKAVTPHAVIEVRSGNGEVVWRFDRDGKKPVQVLRPQVAMDMNFMMNKAVEEGTGRRTMLEGIKSAGKTGTTNAYRDAWFVGYTGNYVGGRVVRQRRLCADQPHDRRLAARHDLAARSWPMRTRASRSSRCRASRRDRPRPRRRSRPRRPPAAAPAQPRPDHADQALDRGAAAGRAHDGERDAHARRPRSSRSAAPPIAGARTRSRRPTPAALRAATDAGAIETIVRLLLGFLFAFAVAAAFGLGLTQFALTRGTAFGAITIGAWTAWPKTGTADIDPYARAAIARSGELPIGSGDGVAFFASSDDAGRALDGRCVVTLSGVTPAARFWTMTLYDLDGRLVPNAADRYGFTSQEIARQRRRQLRDRDGAARAPRQLAADRRHRPLRRGAAALRHAGRRCDAHRQGRADAGGRAGGCP